MTTQAALEYSDGRIQTRFGEFLLSSPQVIEFADGLPGFEGCQRFVLIINEQLAPLSCLQGLDAPFPSFLAANPSQVRPGFHPRLSDADRASLDVSDGDQVLWLVLLTIGTEQVTANLRAPVAVNPATMSGRQVILEDPELPVAWPVETR